MTEQTSAPPSSPAAPAPATSVASTPLTRRRRRWPWVLAGLLVLLALPVVALAWLLATESGLRTVAGLADRFTEGQVQLEGVSGRVLGPLRVERIRVDMPALRVAVDELALDWQPARLLERALIMDRLSAAAVRVAAAPAEAPEEDAGPPAHPPAFELPLSLTLAELSLQRFELQDWADPEAPPVFSFDRLRARLDSDGRTHRLSGLGVALPFGEASLDAKVNTADEHYPLAASARLQGSHEGRDFDLRVRADGVAAQPRVQLDANGAGLSGQAQAVVAPFEAMPLRELALQLGEIDPAMFVAEAPRAGLMVDVDLKASADGRWALSGPLRVDNRLPGALDDQAIPLVSFAAELSWTPELTRIDGLDIRLPEQGRINGQLEWRPDLTDGTLGRLVAELELAGVRTAALQRSLPPATLAGRIQAQGDEREQRATLALSVDRARLEAEGLFQVAEGGQPARFEAQGRLQHVDPSRVLAEAPSADLNLSFGAEGSLGEVLALAAHWQFAPSHLHGMALEGEGRLALQGERLAHSDLWLSLAGNRVELNGAWGGAGDALAFRLDAPELQALHALQAGLGGVLRAQGRVGGSRQQPVGEFELFAERLHLPGEVGIASLNAQGRLEAGLDGPLNLALGLSGLGPLDGEADWLDSLTLTVSGRRDAHALQLALGTPDEDRVELSLNGALLEGSTAASPAGAAAQDGMRWRGQLAGLEVAGRFPLKLLEPAALTLARDRIELAGAQIDAGEHGRINLQETVWSPADIRLRGELTGLTFDLVSPEARSPRSRTGPLSLGAEWNLRLSDRARGQLRVFRESGDLRIPGEFSTRIGLEALELRLNAEDNRLALSVQASGSELGQLNGSVTALAEKTPEGGWRLAPDAALLGSARFEMPSLAWLSRLMQDDIELGGSLAADFSFSGTPANPVAVGRLSGEALSVVLVEHGMRLSGGSLLAEFDRDRLRLTRFEFVSPNRVTPEDHRLPVARFTAEPGRLVASGEIALDSGEGAFSFEADRLPILQRIDRWMILSGKGAATSTWSSLGLEAAFSVDTGFIGLGDTPAPSLSDDVVFVDTEAADGAGGGMQVNATVRVNLGDQLYLSALGLDTRLTGGLEVRLRHGEPMVAVGTVATLGGVFKNYGQNLTIERGQINFQGPLDNPGLNVVALRKGLPVEAGISVGGNVRRPIIRLVSEPDVPDPEKLSWIVLGRAPSGSSGSEMGLLLPAANALLGSGMAGDLARGLGFDEFGVGQGELGTTGRSATSRVVGGGSAVTSDAAVSGQVLTLGKRLSSDMMLSFEQSLGGAESLVKLSYQISRRVSFVMRGGTNNSADMYYTVSFR